MEEIQKIHSHNIFTHKAECKKEGRTSIKVEEITCLDCLELDKKEWVRQVKTFKHQPLINAKRGLARVEERLTKLKKEVSNSSQA